MEIETSIAKNLDDITLCVGVVSAAKLEAISLEVRVARVVT
jgi:hypothetical protein